MPQATETTHYADVQWGAALCVARCMRVAECLYEGLPLCLDCAEDLFERQIAVEHAPQLRELLPPVWEK